MRVEFRQPSSLQVQKLKKHMLQATPTSQPRRAPRSDQYKLKLYPALARKEKESEPPSPPMLTHMAARTSSPLLGPPAHMGTHSRLDEARAVASTLAAAGAAQVVMEGAVDVDTSSAPGDSRRASFVTSFVERKWGSRHLTLLANGTLCMCASASRDQPTIADTEFAAGNKATTRLMLYGALCVRCPSVSTSSGSAKRPHAFFLQTTSRKWTFACSIKGDADAWVQCINDAIAAGDKTTAASRSPRQTGRHVAAPASPLVRPRPVRPG